MEGLRRLKDFELARGQPIETELASARRAIKVDLDNDYHWYLPILIMGSDRDQSGHYCQHSTREVPDHHDQLDNLWSPQYVKFPGWQILE